MLFRQALSIQMEHKPSSSGTFANQIREYESVRDFAASATLAAISDLPFILMFVGVIFFISRSAGAGDRSGGALSAGKSRADVAE